MATKRDVQRAMWAVHFHRYFRPDARPVPPDVWERVKPISLTEAVDILWSDTEETRKAAHGEITVASLVALMRLYTAYALRTLYPEVFRSRFPGRHLPQDLSSVFPVNLKKVREFYARTAVPSNPTSPLDVAAISPLSPLTRPEYATPEDVPQAPLDQLPCPDLGFRMTEQPPDWNLVYPARNYVLDITHHTATGWLSVIWSIDVERPFSGMFQSLDPRNWDVCSASVQIATDAPRYAPPPVSDPGPPSNAGSAWSDYFWEKLGINGDPALELWNQLYFTFNVSAQAIVTTFSDIDPTGNTTVLDTLIEFDRGWAAYGPAPWDASGAWTRLRVVKYLKFTAAWATDLAVVLLHNWADDEARSEAACVIP